MIKNSKSMSRVVARTLTRRHVIDNIIGTLTVAELSRAADKAFEQRGFDRVYELADAADGLKRGDSFAGYGLWPTAGKREPGGTL